MISDSDYRPGLVGVAVYSLDLLGDGYGVPLLSLYEVLQVEEAAGVEIEHQSVPLHPPP